MHNHTRCAPEVLSICARLPACISIASNIYESSESNFYFFSDLCENAVTVCNVFPLRDCTAPLDVFFFRLKAFCRRILLSSLQCWHESSTRNRCFLLFLSISLRLPPSCWFLLSAGRFCCEPLSPWLSPTLACIRFLLLSFARRQCNGIPSDQIKSKRK